MTRVAPQQTHRALRWLLILALALLAGVGYYGAWVPHEAAGLVISGLDLAEFVKFLPAVMSGQVPIVRESFYAPLAVLSCTASLGASRRVIPRWLRLLLALGAIVLALAMLPPAWSPVTLVAAEYRTQVIAIAVCILFLGLTPVTRYVPDAVACLSLAAVVLAGLVLALWSYFQAGPLIAVLYGQSLPFGWGVVTYTGASALLAIGCFAEAISRLQRRPSR